MKLSKITKKILLGITAVTAALFFFVPSAHAAVLVPGNISTCGELASAGTYTLTQAVGSTGVTCFTISSTGVVISAASSLAVNGKIDASGFSFTISHIFLQSSSSNTITTTSVSLTNSSKIAGDTINGNVVLEDSSFINSGTVNGNVTFNGLSSLRGGTISGNATFNGTYYNATAPTGGVFTVQGRSYFGQVTGTSYGSDNNPITSYIFNGTPTGNSGIIAGSVTFNDSSTNSGTIVGNVTFSGSSYNVGTITGNVTFNGTSSARNNFTNTLQSVINGDATFNTTYYNTTAPTGGVFTIKTGIGFYGRITGTTYGSDNNPITSYVFNGTATNNGVITGNATFNSSSSNVVLGSFTGNVIGTATFNSTSSNAATVTGDADFYDDSTNTGTVTGTATFYTINSCRTLSKAGTYTLTADVGSAGVTCFTISASGVTISAATNKTISGDIDATGQSFTLSNIITSGTITATGVTFGGTGYNAGTVTGNATFTYLTAVSGLVADATGYANGHVTGLTKDSLGETITDWYFSDTNLSGSVTGIAHFNNGKVNAGSVYGDAVFSDISYNAGTITGDTTFNDTSYNTDTITGNATFTASTFSYNNSINSVNPQSGTVSGTVYFAPLTGDTVTFNIGESGLNDTCEGVTCTWTDDTTAWDFGAFTPTFNFYGNSYNNGTIVSDAVFNDTSYNLNTITGDATFNDTSYNNSGSVSGDATFTASTFSYNSDSLSVNPQLGGVDGTVYFAPLTGDTVTFNIGESGLDDTCNSSACSWISDTSAWNFGAFTPTFNFYGNSFNSGTIVSDTVFNDTSRNLGAITGDATFTYLTAVAGLVTDVTGYANGNVTGLTKDSLGETITDWDFSDTNLNGIVIGNASFSNGSYIYGGSVYGDVIFNDTSYNNGGNVYGDATFTASTFSYNSVNNAVNPQQGSVSGTVFFAPLTGDTVTFNIGDEGLNDTCNSSACSWTGDTSAWDFGAFTPTFNFYGNSFNNGTIVSDAVFNDTSYNSSTVTGNVTFNDSSYNTNAIFGNADVYYPASNPLGGNTTGYVHYHNYPAFYFNDQAPGAAGDGDWNNALNWWTDDTFTTPAGVVPAAGNDTFIHSAITVDTSGVATAHTATFQGSSQNAISLTVTNGSFFNGTSVNTGDIIGTATFDENGSENQGTVSVIATDNTNTVTRLFTASVATLRNFLTEGGRDNWIIVAQNATVDLSNAVYSRVTNIFKALGNGLFTTNSSIDSGGAVVPQITITTPTSGTNIKWAPVVDWDTATTCEYKMDGDATYTALDCSQNGADIPRPTATSHTLFVKGTDSTGNITEKTVSFSYDNTSPVYTSCGADLLDEATREYYYLTDDVTGPCTITANNTELRGNNHTVTGNVASVGLNFTLENITVTGTTTSQGSTGTNGGDGGNITISSSTTSVISANGGNGTTNGGNGGTINIATSSALASSTLVSSVGGNSTSCGYGGSGGDINLTATYDYIVVNDAGADQTQDCTPPEGSAPGHAGGGQIIAPPAGGGGGGSPPPSPPSVIYTSAPQAVGSGGTPFVPAGTNIGLPHVSLPVNTIGNLKLHPLPSFGSGKKDFSFALPIKSFLFEPLPEPLARILVKAPELKAYLADRGFQYAQDLVTLTHNPLTLDIPEKNSDIPAGLLMVSTQDKPVPLTLVYNKKDLAVEHIFTATGTSLTISMYPLKKGTVTATLDGTTYTMEKLGSTSLLSTTITTPSTPGVYTFSSLYFPLDLTIEILPPPAPTPQRRSIWSWFSWIPHLFGW